MNDSALQPGIVLNGRYRLTEHLGNGGMAEVWLASDETLGRRVAVKILSTDLADDTSFRQRFKREAAAMAATDNRFLVSVYDFGYESASGTCYIVMEYIPGDDLKTVISENGPIPPRRAAKLGAQVCSALSSIHGAGITHNDIKPANIMIKGNGDACVMDLGIFKPQNSLQETTGNMVLGTVAYCSPEQCRGEDLTPCSDIYSLGIMLYEITSGTVPFTGDDPIEVATKQCDELPVRLADIVPGIDPEFDAIVMRALEKDPANRFQSAAEIGRALENYALGRSQFENAQTRVMPAQQANGQTSVMPNAGGAATSYMSGDAENGEDGDEKKKLTPKQKKILVASIAGGIAVLIAIIALIVSMLGGAKVSVPDVTGMSVSDAVSALEGQGFKVEQEKVPSKDVKDGDIIGTDPSSGTEVDKGSTVKLEISSGPQQVSVPDVTGMKEAQAISTLKSAGLTPKAGSPVSSDSVSEGSVVVTDPASGTEVDAGSTVTYSLSSGKSTVSVPNLNGMSENEAIAALEAVGLNGTVGQQVESDTIAAGNVTSQTPASGTKIAAGSTVTINVSAGTSSATVPSVTGMSQALATSTIKNAGFVLGNVSEEYSSESAGTVIRQSPSDGTSAKKGSSVDIVISKGKQPSQNSDSSSNSSGNSSSNNSASSSSTNNSSANNSIANNSETD